MIEYKKAVNIKELLVEYQEKQVLVYHKDSLDGGILCIDITEIDSLHEDEILARFNAHIDWILNCIATERPIEIREGNPQIKWDRACEQWIPVGDVLRCEVSWHPPGPAGAIAILIDDKRLSGQEFLKLLEVHEGLGMRIEFMDLNRLTNPPKPKIRKRGR